MVFVGALYTPEAFLASNSPKCSFRLLLAVMNHPVSTLAHMHLLETDRSKAETRLKTPEIPTVQACLFFCALLAMARDSVANSSWSLFLPRVMSLRP
jgi:hypothetical protein